MDKLPCQDEIERIIRRRLHENRIDGFTLEMSREIAELIQPPTKLIRALSCYRHSNGNPVWADDGTMLDESGARSIFDDVDL